jgi:hypothetical protein
MNSGGQGGRLVVGGELHSQAIFLVALLIVIDAPVARETYSKNQIKSGENYRCTSGHSMWKSHTK